jgi:ParB family chromosome partitioning protein
VARTEKYVEGALAEQKAAQDKPRRAMVIRDVRFFLNSLDHSLTLMRSAGVDARCQRREEGDALLVTIRIPKTEAR